MATESQAPVDARPEWRTDGVVDGRRRSAGTTLWVNFHRSKPQNPNENLVFCSRHKQNTSCILFCVSRSGTFPSCSPDICPRVGMKVDSHCWLALPWLCSGLCERNQVWLDFLLG
jgi:hypothetical protein